MKKFKVRIAVNGDRYDVIIETAYARDAEKLAKLQYGKDARVVTCTEVK